MPARKWGSKAAKESVLANKLPLWAAEIYFWGTGRWCKTCSSELSHSRGRGLSIYPPTSTNCWVRTAREKHEFSDIPVCWGQAK